MNTLGEVEDFDISAELFTDEEVKSLVQNTLCGNSERLKAVLEKYVDAAPTDVLFSVDADKDKDKYEYLFRQSRYIADVLHICLPAALTLTKQDECLWTCLEYLKLMFSNTENKVKLLEVFCWIFDDSTHLRNVTLEALLELHRSVCDHLPNRLLTDQDVLRTVMSAWPYNIDLLTRFEIHTANLRAMAVLNTLKEEEEEKEQHHSSISPLALYCHILECCSRNSKGLLSWTCELVPGISLNAICCVLLMNKAHLLSNSQLEVVRSFKRPILNWVIGFCSERSLYFVVHVCRPPAELMNTPPVKQICIRKVKILIKAGTRFAPSVTEVAAQFCGVLAFAFLVKHSTSWNPKSCCKAARRNRLHGLKIMSSVRKSLRVQRRFDLLAIEDIADSVVASEVKR